MLGSSRQFSIAAIKQFLLSSVMLIVQIGVFVASAGNVPEPRPWLYFGIAFVHYFVSIWVQYKLNPQLVVQRLKTKQKGSKLWDEVLMRVSNLSVIILIPVVAGLDIGRFQWSSLPVYFVVIGVFLVVLSSFLLNWAMVVNPHFEPTVRIQEDHKVIARGPYSIVRHPGYLSGILFTLSIPLIIGSAFTFIPVAIYWVLMLIRTWLEDKTLQKELEGYSEYAKRTRFRLIPGIW
jgi:protein-S-isoprenylcysteine O-methyltransferase Ste14